jgi:SPP1 family predicted phage head-tail adaptor
MIGDYRHRVVFQNPTRVADSDGGYTQTWADLTPGTWFAAITPASPNDLERFTVGTVITQLAHIVRGRYLAGVTTATRMVFDGRTFAIAGTRNVDERKVTMELLAVELSS